MSRRESMYSTFAEFSDAMHNDHVHQDRLNLIVWTSTGAVTIEEEGDPIVDDDGDEVDREPSTILLRVDAADLFAIQVIEAMGGKGRIA